MIVDSSVALSWAFADEKSAVSQALYVQAAQDGVEVPAIWPFEVANKLYIGLQKGRLTPAEMRQVLVTFLLLGIRVHEVVPLPLLVASAANFGLTAYDAAFVELARVLSQPLATFDTKMRAAAQAVGVAVLR